MTTARRLRGPRLVAAPLVVLGLVGASSAVALVLWGVWNPGQLGVAFWVPCAVSAAIGVLGFIAARGCFVEVSDDEVRDVVGWIRLQRVDRADIDRVEVRLGAWRWFVLVMDDGSTRTLLGASPAQFPARLFPGSDDRDLADVDVLLGRR